MKLAKQALLAALRTSIRLILTDLLRWRERKTERRALVPLRLHLGCGLDRKPGWTNVDLFGYGDMALNLSHPYRIASGIAECIFQEHLLEHLTLRQGFGLLSECFRIRDEDGPSSCCTRRELGLVPSSQPGLNTSTPHSITFRTMKGYRPPHEIPLSRLGRIAVLHCSHCCLALGHCWSAWGKVQAGLACSKLRRIRVSQSAADWRGPIFSDTQQER